MTAARPALASIILHLALLALLVMIRVELPLTRQDLEGVELDIADFAAEPPPSANTMAEQGDDQRDATLSRAEAPSTEPPAPRAEDAPPMPVDPAMASSTVPAPADLPVPSTSAPLTNTVSPAPLAAAAPQPSKPAELPPAVAPKIEPAPPVTLAPVPTIAPIIPTTAIPVPQNPAPEARPVASGAGQARDGSAPAPSAAATKPTNASVASPARRAIDKAGIAAAIERSGSAASPGPQRRQVDASAIGNTLARASGTGNARLSFRQRANLQRMIRDQITPCWNPPPPEERSGIVTVVMRIRLEKDGQLSNPPELVRYTGQNPANLAYSRTLAGSVRRAIIRCAPLRLPPELHDQWADVELNFDPRDLL